MILSVVVPCFNEELVLPETSKRLGEVLNELINNNKISLGSHILFVDDGSSDGTWEIIENLADDNPIYRGIKLSRNKGHQLALLAGLHSAEGDIVISVDADLQDDLNAIGEMIDEYHLGSDVVYGVRKSRQKDTFFKRFSAEVYYRLLRFMGVDVIFNHADIKKP